MGSDSVDVFKKVVFKIPPTSQVLPGILFFGAVYGVLTYFGLRLFTPHEVPPISVVYLSLLGYILPALVSGESLHTFIPDYPRRWGYFLAFCNQFVLFVYGLILTGADTFATGWSVFWLALITVYLSSFVVLMLTLGYGYLRRIGALSLVQPVLILASFHLLIGSGLDISPLSYLTNFGVALIAAVGFISFTLVAELLIGANVDGVSVLELTSGLLLKKKKRLDLGYPFQPDVQTLSLENRNSRVDIAVPWIHPGPLEGFGGGQITSDVIDALNDGDRQGFFLHVPSTHKSDPTDPEDYKKIVNAVEKPETSGEASRLVKKDYGEVRFYGRNLDGKKIVFLDLSDSDRNYDDYEVSVFRELIDPEETMVVDLHNHERKLTGEREEVWYNTEDAEILRGYFRDFTERLEAQESSDYRCGFETDLDGTKVFSLVEEVDGQKTLLFGIEGNEKGNELERMREACEDDFDEVLVFTTDTHRSIHELSREKQVEVERLRDTINKARENLSKGSVGFGNQRAEEMNLLRENYLGLVFSINIIVRLGLFMFVLLYLGLVVWLF
jgi:putative membrane protein